MPEIGDPAVREILHNGYRIFHLVGGDEDAPTVDILSVFHTSRAFGGGGGD